jgi:hypothetical protein
VVTLAVPAKNPVPTSGELRAAWANSRRTLLPAMPYLQDGAYLVLGLVLAGATLRALRGRYLDRGQLSRDGEQALRALSSRPVVQAATSRVSELASTVAETTQRAADETHDSVEELYYHLDQFPRAVRDGVAGLPRRLWSAVRGTR